MDLWQEVLSGLRFLTGSILGWVCVGGGGGGRRGGALLVSNLWQEVVWGDLGSVSSFWQYFGGLEMVWDFWKEVLVWGGGVSDFLQAVPGGVWVGLWFQTGSTWWGAWLVSDFWQKIVGGLGVDPVFLTESTWGGWERGWGAGAWLVLSPWSNIVPNTRRHCAAVLPLIAGEILDLEINFCQRQQQPPEAPHGRREAPEGRPRAVERGGQGSVHNQGQLAH